MPKQSASKATFLMLCDDVREEKHGKLTLVGTYGSNIFVPTLPFMFSKLCVYTRWTSLKKTDTLQLFVEGPKRKKVFAMEGPASDSFGEGHSDAAMVFCFVPFKVEKPGDYTIVLMVNGDRKTSSRYRFTVQERGPENLS